MLALYIAGAALVVLLSILFKVAAVFRLSIPLAYALIVPTFFRGWREANPVLSEAIFYILLGLTLLSWIYSLVKRIPRQAGRGRIPGICRPARFAEAASQRGRHD